MAKKCRQCKTLFSPVNSLEAVCGFDCAVLFAKTPKGEDYRVKAVKRENRERKAALKKPMEHKKEAQKAFNKFIRLRDADQPCISCGRENVEWTRGGSWDCGHFLSVGAKPELRFEELNAHKQCKSCNGGSGKYARKNHTVTEEYRVRLIEKIGLEQVEWLEGPHEPKRYRIEDFKEIKARYNKLAIELEKNGNN